ncbi:hypothetical protein Gotri_014396 [Gossypium trilobum]|uniref:RNase H type-1 domain-containing protein n=1 Tax=Gossypium trilobum TaxID=34281 RepID=A0A7J9DWL8_9ROSI|nr:hypothetical protein [Gossypium trilobum]
MGAAISGMAYIAASDADLAYSFIAEVNPLPDFVIPLNGIACNQRKQGVNVNTYGSVGAFGEQGERQGKASLCFRQSSKSVIARMVWLGMKNVFAAVGRLVRDHNGGWIIRFFRYLVNSTVIEAKLRGILDGQKLILYRRFKRVSIQTDNLEAANAIQDGYSESSNSALVRRIHQLLKMVKQ